MTWIHVNAVAVVTDEDGDEHEIPKGLPRRAPWMDEVLSENDREPEDHLPIDYNDNRNANVPDPLADAMVDRWGHVEYTEGEAA